jgi:Skp family chaperone for outer membrane proteins
MKNLLFSLSIIAVTAVLSVAAAAQNPAPPRPAGIGYINPQRIFAESSEGKADVARVVALQQQKASELRVRQQTLDTTRQQLAQAADGPTRTPLLQQETVQRTDLERATAQAQADIQTLQREVNTELLNRVKSVLDVVAKEQNIQLVLNADASLIWAAPGTGADLTSVVIERMNAKSTAAAPASKP